MTPRSQSQVLTQWSEVLLSQCQLKQELAYTDQLLEKALVKLVVTEKSQGQGSETTSLGVHL